jgi:hypothetical protein
MSELVRRRSAVLRFVAGVGLAVLLGCAFAAVDLWGGVRTLGIGPRAFGALGIVSAALVVSGAVGWVLSWPEGERPRRVFMAVAALTVVAGVSGGGLFAYYAARLETSAETCRRAGCASTRAERERLLDEGLGPLFPVIDPDYACIALEGERRKSRQNVTMDMCTEPLFDDVPCQCGSQAWTAHSEARCTSGRRTTCEVRGSRLRTIGCASDQIAEDLRCVR